MGVQAVADALADALGAVAGFERAYAWVPDLIEPPCIVVGFPKFAPWQPTMSRAGVKRWRLDVTAIVARTDAINGQRLLAAALDAGTGTDLVGAVEADPTLGGACDTLIVLEDVGGYGEMKVGDTSYLGIGVGLEIWG